MQSRKKCWQCKFKCLETFKKITRLFISVNNNYYYFNYFIAEFF